MSPEFIAGHPLESLLVKAVTAPILATTAYLFIRRVRTKREL